MQKKIFLFFVLLLLSSQVIDAQSKFSFSVGGGYLYSYFTADKLSHWKNGHLINFSASHSLNEKLSLSIFATYKAHYFDNQSLELASPDIVGYRLKVDSEDSKSYELGLKVKYYSNKNFIKPFFSLGAGILYIDQGKVTVTNWMEGKEELKNINVLRSSNNEYFIEQFIIGTGLEFEIIKNINFIIEADLAGNFSDGPIYFPLISSLKFGL